MESTVRREVEVYVEKSGGEHAQAGGEHAQAGGEHAQAAGGVAGRRVHAQADGEPQFGAGGLAVEETEGIRLVRVVGRGFKAVSERILFL